MPRRKAETLEQLGGRGLFPVDHDAGAITRQHLGHTVFAHFLKFVQALRQHGEFHRLADFHESRVRLDGALHDFEERSLTRAVLTQDAHAVARDPRSSPRCRAPSCLRSAPSRASATRTACPSGRMAIARSSKRVTHGRFTRDKLLGKRHMELRLRRTRAGAAGKPCEFLAHEILASARSPAPRHARRAAERMPNTRPRTGRPRRHALPTWHWRPRRETNGRESP